MCKRVDFERSTDVSLLHVQQSSAIQDASVVDEHVHLSHILSNLLGHGVDVSRLTDITGVGMSLPAELSHLRGCGIIVLLQQMSKSYFAQ